MFPDPNWLSTSLRTTRPIVSCTVRAALEVGAVSRQRVRGARVCRNRGLQYESRCECAYDCYRARHGDGCSEITRVQIRLNRRV